VTERPEAIEAGAARLVGTSKAEILTRMTALLDDPQRAARFASCRDIYGDGGAARRIVDILVGRQVEEFRVEAAAKVTVAAE
jgi:UDP-N-acetylglucosamine 2-epimerase (non-hydrolysing)